MGQIRSMARAVPLALLTAVVAVSFAAIFFRQAQPTHPLVAAGLRLAFACAMLAVPAARSIVRRRPGKRLVGHAVAAGVLYAVHFGAWVASLGMTTVAASVTLVTTTPLLLAATGLIVGRDRPTRGLWVALLGAAVGVLLIGSVDFGAGAHALMGEGLALLGAAAIAAYLALARRVGAAMNLWLFTCIATGVGALALLTTAAASGIAIRAASGEALMYLLLAAAVPQLIGHTLLTWALRHTTPSVVAMAVVGEPVGATMLAWVWLGETIGPIVVVGCAITLGSILLAIRTRPETMVEPEAA